jgi:hypothetical protein
MVLIAQFDAVSLSALQSQSLKLLPVLQRIVGLGAGIMVWMLAFLLSGKNNSLLVQFVTPPLITVFPALVIFNLTRRPSPILARVFRRTFVVFPLIVYLLAIPYLVSVLIDLAL